ncbi:hypothetical protein [Streptococcus intermedius]
MKPKHYPYSGKKRLPKIVSADKSTEIVLSAIDSCVFQLGIDKGKEKQCKPEKYF